MNTEPPPLDPDAMMLTGLSHCIVGSDQNGNLIYEHLKLMEHFMREDAMSFEDAAEWISFNIVGLNGNFIILYLD
jgi:hypothetical protein